MAAAPLGAMLMAAGSGRTAAADTSAAGIAESTGGANAMDAPRHKFDLEFLYRRLSIIRSPVEILGPTPTGLRVNIHTMGGEFEGPKMKGEVLPGFGDALVIRRDGVGVIDSRTNMKTDDGALIIAYYMGIVDFGEGAYEKLLSGQPTPEHQLHVSPRFETAHPKYAWLNRVQGVGIGQHDAKTTTNLWDFYAIRRG
jgi:hypothetical protein